MKKYKLTPDQNREYEKLKINGSQYVYGNSLRRVYEKLVEYNLATTDHWNWFHLK